MNLRQIQDTPNTRVLQFHEVASLHMTFDCADAFAAPVGTPVKLGSDSKVVVAAATDAIFGLVYVKKHTQHNGKNGVGVSVNFKAQIKGVASGAVTCGTEVTTDGVTSEAVKYKTAATGDKVVGIALATAADTADVIVGCFTQHYKK